HLLYIARTQAKLGKLVEAAETYRRLVRVKLEGAAPEASEQAIDDAKKELAELEPSIPSLRVEIAPAGVKDVELSIDGEKVSSAVVGVDRPINPGEHDVVATASGYERSERKVSIARGEKQKLELALKAGAGGPGPLASASKDQGESKVPEGDEAASKLGLFFGLRLLATIPAGDVGSVDLDGTGSNKVAMSGVVQSGGGVELHGGLRFARYFAGKLYLDLMSLKAGDRLAKNSTVSGFETGLGFHVGTEAHHFGGFGELGLGFTQQLLIHQESEMPQCVSDLTLRGGPTLRVGGGAVIPLGKYFQITPFMIANFGQYSARDLKVRCALLPASNRDDSGGIAPSDRASHELFLLGVGGDWLVGG
ncbi:MAG TPA: hypothetical protein VGP93_05780, partial [Polyangiaceae bacterium]|nr:hypothetical protein [Polyangiaceae bacterium]